MTMQLSEAIRLGSLLKPQGFGAVLQWKIDGTIVTCAYGAALDAVGRVKLSPGGVVLESALPEWNSFFCGSPTACPECGKETRMQIIVAHLNDDHHWTRERIADFVEIVEQSLERRIAEPEALANA